MGRKGQDLEQNVPTLGSPHSFSASGTQRGFGIQFPQPPRSSVAPGASPCHPPAASHMDFALPAPSPGARNPSDIFVLLTDGLGFQPNHAAGTGNVLIITQGVNCFPGRAFVSPSSAEMATAGKVNKCQMQCFIPEPRAFIKTANESNN